MPPAFNLSQDQTLWFKVAVAVRDNLCSPATLSIKARGDDLPEGSPDAGTHTNCLNNSMLKNRRGRSSDAASPLRSGIIHRRSCASTGGAVRHPDERLPTGTGSHPRGRRFRTPIPDHILCRAPPAGHAATSRRPRDGEVRLAGRSSSDPRAVRRSILWRSAAGRLAVYGSCRARAAGPGPRGAPGRSGRPPGL